MNALAKVSLFIMLALGGLGLPASVAAGQEASPGMPQAPRQGDRQHTRVQSPGDIPDLKRLKGPEIGALLAGKTLESDVQSEKFAASGSWSVGLRMRAAVYIEGTWSVEGDNICVTTEKWPKACRDVYMQESTKALWMAEYWRPRPGELYLHTLWRSLTP